MFFSIFCLSNTLQIITIITTSMSRKKFSVVQAIESVNSLNLNQHVVPINWIQDNKLYYPPSKLGSEMIKSIIMAGPDSGVIVDKVSWKKFAIIEKKRFKTFAEADKYLEVELKTISDTDTSNLKKLKLLQGFINGCKYCFN